VRERPGDRRELSAGQDHQHQSKNSRSSSNHLPTAPRTHKLPEAVQDQPRPLKKARSPARLLQPRPGRLEARSNTVRLRVDLRGADSCGPHASASEPIVATRAPSLARNGHSDTDRRSPTASRGSEWLGIGACVGGC